jgi:hypothetical protein
VGSRRIALDIGNLKGHAVLDGLTGAGLTDANMTAFELCNYGLVEAERSANCGKRTHEDRAMRNTWPFLVSGFAVLLIGAVVHESVAQPNAQQSKPDTRSGTFHSAEWAWLDCREPAPGLQSRIGLDGQGHMATC